MAIQLKSTRSSAAQAIKALIYGESKGGKTYLVKSLHDRKPGSVLILTTEKGNLSLGDWDIPSIDINSIEDFREAYEKITTDPAYKAFERIALDSITDIAETCLSAEKRKLSDGRAAYGNTNDIIGDMVRKFRDIPDRDIYFIAQLDKVQDEKGKLMYGPAMPGKTLTQQLPFWFDIVLALRVETGEDGKPMRVFQCESDGQWIAGNRGGKLAMWEYPADLAMIFDKIRGVWVAPVAETASSSDEDGAE